MNNSLIPVNEEIKALDMMATAANDSKFFSSLNGKAGIFSIMLYARELGLPPMQCIMGGMHNIQGKITISAQLMNAMIRKAGHKLEIDSNELRCIINGIRKDNGESCKVSFTVEDAKKAGIYKEGGGWAKYPSDMCFARALSRLARRLFSDVIGTAYVEGEIEEDDKNKIKSTHISKDNEKIVFEEAVNIVEIIDERPLAEDQVSLLDDWCVEFPDFKKAICDRYKKENIYFLNQTEFEQASVMVASKRKLSKEAK